ncbi:MAG TPA: ABC transporter permease [Candidatus Saccharimonadales bacterium]|nr:ABC transporter permease [Candidatus Saccharimonadales bacterium]
MTERFIIRWLPFWTVLRRELSRFWSIKRQTIFGPLLETYLYISIFGAALGSRINELDGHRYIIFIVPGLIMMSFAINIFINNSFSILQQKLQRAIDDQLASPVSNTELLAAFGLGGFIRATIVSGIALITAKILLPDLPIAHPVMFTLSFIFIGLFFAMAGVLVGLRAEKFDDISLYQNFILQPLIFLGGVFYSASLLPGIFETLTRFNPVYYMISTLRYSMLGDTDINPNISLTIIAVVGLLLFGLNYRLFKSGYKLRA